MTRMRKKSPCQPRLVDTSSTFLRMDLLMLSWFTSLLSSCALAWEQRSTLLVSVSLVWAGSLLAFTSYVSSFPEFMLTYRYAIANKRTALLGMLFGSNVIDLGFSGFRSIWLNENVIIETGGLVPGLLPAYILALPLIAILSAVFIAMGKVKYSVAYPAMVFYVIYIGSGLILL